MWWITKCVHIFTCERRGRAFCSRRGFVWNGGLLGELFGGDCGVSVRGVSEKSLIYRWIKIVLLADILKYIRSSAFMLLFRSVVKYSFTPSDFELITSLHLVDVDITQVLQSSQILAILRLFELGLLEEKVSFLFSIFKLCLYSPFLKFRRNDEDNIAKTWEWFNKIGNSFNEYGISFMFGRLTVVICETRERLQGNDYVLYSSLLMRSIRRGFQKSFTRKCYIRYTLFAICNYVFKINHRTILLR